MDDSRMAAGLIAAGPILFAAAGLITPQGLYQESDHAARLLIIDGEHPRFLIAQVLWIAWLALPMIGWVLLSRQLIAPIAWLPTVAAVALALGAVLGTGFVVLQTVDPLRFWLSGEAAWVSSAGAWLFLVAAVLYGVSMISIGGWTVAGYVLVVYAAVGVAALLLSAPAFFVVAGFSLAALAPAVVLWQASPT